MEAQNTHYPFNISPIVIHDLTNTKPKVKSEDSRKLKWEIEGWRWKLRVAVMGDGTVR
ncbi:Hypothetical predicted protein, partial [Olea europaea subsp. europaea]